MTTSILAQIYYLTTLKWEKGRDYFAERTDMTQGWQNKLKYVFSINSLAEADYKYIYVLHCVFDACYAACFCTYMCILCSSLIQVEVEIENMEGNISRLKAAIDEKLAPLKVAHTRLAHRSQRPNIELTKDPAQYQLVSEVKMIENSIAVSFYLLLC